MVRQRTNALIKSAYEYLDNGDTEAIITLIEPILIRPRS